MFDTDVFAQRLKQKRQQAGLSPAKLAGELNKRYGITIGRDSVTNYETSEEYAVKHGKNKGMNVTYLWCLADFFHVSIDWLIGNLPQDVETPQADIQAVCEYTNLTEAAVDGLQNPTVYNFINRLFANGLVKELEAIRLWVENAAKHNAMTQSTRKQIKGKDSSFKSPRESFEPPEEWYYEKIINDLQSVHATAQQMYSERKSFHDKQQQKAEEAKNAQKKQ